MRLVILGPPGAGKGTQAAVVARECGIPHVSTGDLFRAHVQSETQLGLQARAYIERGELVPDDLVIRMVTERFNWPDAWSGFVLDGFPRTVPQAEALDVVLQERDMPLEAVLRLVVPESELLARLDSRREQQHRSDDDTEVIRKRLVEYRSKTAPLETFYAERGLLRDVDGLGGVEEVSARILHAVADLDPA